MSCGLYRETDCTDEQLAFRAGRGCGQSFAGLVDRLGPAILVYLQRRLGNRHAAEDVMQETFLCVHGALERYDPLRPLRPWLYSIATRQAISYQRKCRPLTNVPVDPRDSCPQVLERLVQAEEQETLWNRAHRLLSAESVATLHLRYVEQLSIGQIGQILEKKTGAVRVLLHRARTKLIEAEATVRQSTPDKEASCGLQ